ncbi:hypothetical protein HGE74_08910 [Rhodobacteraceae bacterium R_SAG1]|nr:hypothetical protein [Rhodobacteraceae bacterium R_SAG1]
MTVALFSATDETAISCDTLCLDPFEAGMLPVLRHLLTSLQVPESQAWQHAFQIAAERWGASFGLGVAQALVPVVARLHALRGQGVELHDPLDLDQRDRLSADEAALLLVLHHMRRDQTSQARDALADLLMGRMDADLIRAALGFAHRFPAAERAEHLQAAPVDRPQSRAVLRVVR